MVGRGGTPTPQRPTDPGSRRVCDGCATPHHHFLTCKSCSNSTCFRCINKDPYPESQVPSSVFRWAQAQPPAFKCANCQGAGPPEGLQQQLVTSGLLSPGQLAEMGGRTKSRERAKSKSADDGGHSNDGDKTQPEDTNAPTEDTDPVHSPPSPTPSEGGEGGRNDNVAGDQSAVITPATPRQSSQPPPTSASPTHTGQVMGDQVRMLAEYKARMEDAEQRLLSAERHIKTAEREAQVAMEAQLKAERTAKRQQEKLDDLKSHKPSTSDPVPFEDDEEIRKLRELQRRTTADAQASQSSAKEESDPDETTKLLSKLVELQAQLVQGQQQRRDRPALSQMPKRELPKFDGKVTEFPDWRASWRVWVDTDQWDDKLKIDWLLQSLKGTPLQKVKGLGASGAAYAEAMAILEREYGGATRLIEAAEKDMESLPTVQQDYSNLETFVDRARGSYNLLRRQGLSEARLSAQVPLLWKKLPRDLKLDMLKSFKTTNYGSMKVHEVLDYLVELGLTLKSIDPPGKGNDNGRGHNGRRDGKKSPADPTMLLASANETQGGIPRTAYCILCEEKGKHYPSQCPCYPTTSERRKKIVELERCFGCLGTGHRAMDCRKTKPCYTCGSTRHHRALCFKEGEKDGVGGHRSKGPGAKKGYTGPKKAQYEHSCPAIPSHTSGSVILATFHALLKNPTLDHAEEVDVWVYVDPGATVSFIRQEHADKLQLPVNEERELHIASFGSKGRITTVGQCVEFQLKSYQGFTLPMEAWTTENICAKITLRPTQLPQEMLQRLEGRGLQLMNMPVLKKTRKHVDLLVGVDYSNCILHSPGGTVEQLTGSVVLNHSPFGDLLYGKTKTGESKGRKKKEERDGGEHALMLSTDQALRRMYEQDGLEMGEERTHAEELDSIMKEGFKRREDGSYEVPLPLKQPSPKLESSRDQACKRLWQFWTRTTKKGTNFEAMDLYAEQWATWVKDGIVHEVKTEDDEESKLVHYLSHFAVIKKSSATTKVRPVLDASMKTGGGLSLNDILHTGPNLLTNLLGIQLRARMGRFLVISDIKSAFLALHVAREYQSLLRIVWLKDPHRPPTLDNLWDLEFANLAFGTTVAPFLLQYTLQQHLKLYPERPIAAKMARNTYMDDISVCLDSEDEVLKAYREMKEILGDAKMNLRQFLSNSKGFDAKIPEEDRGKGPKTKLLGVGWDTETDELYLHKIPDGAGAKTKREILSLVSTVFDIFHMAAPVMITAKLFIKHLWELQKDWDEEIGDGERKRWLEINTEMQKLKSFSLERRWIKDPSKPIKLIGFSDAAKDAHAVVIYAFQDLGDKTNLKFVVGKARVNPLSVGEIPRLELLGVLQALKVLDFVTKECSGDIRIEETRLYTDSSVAWWQVKGNKSKEIFVRNRVNRIHEIMAKLDCSLKFVPGESNPADAATRGLTWEEFKESCWISGPKWLQVPAADWPEWDQEMYKSGGNGNPDGPEDKPEESGKESEGYREPEGGEKLEESVMMTTTKKTGTMPRLGPFGIVSAHYSTLKRLISITAYCTRFVAKARRLPCETSEFPVAEERMKAREKWEHWQQEAYYPRELEAMKTGKEKSNKLCCKLDLYLDEQGLLRKRTRLQNAPLAETQKFPILLARRHAFTKLAMQEAHEECGHQRKASTLAEFSKRYYAPSAVRLAFHIVQTCLRCRQVDGQPFKGRRFAPYPRDRLRMGAVWRQAGADLLGPLTVREDGEAEKRWVLVYVCLLVKALDLELLQDYSAQSLVQAYRRIFARRGIPEVLWTDNGKNFLLAGKFLKGSTEKAEEWQLQHPDVENYLARREVRCKTIAERNPRAGGTWEAMVKLTRKLLTKSLYKTTATGEELRTLLPEIATTINSRPLFVKDIDMTQDVLLTANHLIAPSTRLGLLPCERSLQPQTPTMEKLLEEVPYILRTQTRVWKVFQNLLYEYLAKQPSGAGRNQAGGRVKREPRVGEVVLVKEPSARLTYPLAKVEEILPSSDNIPRNAIIRLKSGTKTRRAIDQLIPLEVMPEVQEEDEEGDGGDRESGESEGEREAGKGGGAGGKEPCNSPPSLAGENGDRKTPPPPNRKRRFIADPNLEEEEEEEEDDELQTGRVGAGRGRGSGIQSPRKEGEGKGRGARGRLPAAAFIVLLALATFPAASAKAFEPHQERENRMKNGSVEVRDQTFQLCVEGPGGTRVKLPTLSRRCDNEDQGQKKMVKTKALVYYPSGELPKVTAYRCHLEIVEALTFTTFLGQPMPLRKKRRLESIGANECRRAMMTKKYGKLPVYELGNRIYGTNESQQPAYRWCCRTIITTTKNLIILEGQLAFNKQNQLSSDLGELGGCYLVDRNCLHRQYVIVWEEWEEPQYCPFETKGPYEALLAGTRLLLPRIQAALTLTKKRSHYQRQGCLPQQALSTEEGPLVQLATRKRGRRDEANMGQETEEVIEWVESLDPVNPKLHYIAASIEDQITHTFNTLYGIYCKIALQQERQLQQLIHLDPTRGARSLLGREDVAATLQGRLLHIYLCHALNVTKIYADHRLPGMEKGTCMDRLPVRGKNTGVLFVYPGTMDLTRQAKVVKCEGLKTEPYQPEPRPGKEAVWHTVSGRLFASAIQRESTLQLHFEAPPLYHARILVPGTSVADTNQRLDQLRAQMEYGLNLTAQLTGHETAIWSVIQQLGEGVEKVGSTVGKGLWGLASTGLGSIFSLLIHPVMLLMVKVLLIIVVIALLWLGRGFLWRKLKNCCAQGEARPESPLNVEMRRWQNVPLNEGAGRVQEPGDLPRDAEPGDAELGDLPGDAELGDLPGDAELGDLPGDAERGDLPRDAERGDVHLPRDAELGDLPRDAERGDVDLPRDEEIVDIEEMYKELQRR